MQEYDAYHVAETGSDLSPRASSGAKFSSDTEGAIGEGELRVRIPFIYLYRMLPVARRLN